MLMNKQPLNEVGVVGRFVTALFTAIARGKEKRILTKLQKDPQLQKLAKQAVDARTYLEQYLETQRKDPEWQAMEDEFKKIVDAP
jgi:hypothetical protein